MKKERIGRHAAAWLGFGLGLVGVMGTLGGCVSYTNVPVPESAPAFKSANHFQSIAVVKKALATVIEQYPVEGVYAINLPVGTSPESFEKVIADLPDGAIMPSEEMDSEIPVYHIGRVWIRASDAKVDVIYPFERADGRVEDQSVTVWLSGGVRKWRVYRQQHWAAGTIPTPPVYVPVWPEEEGLIESGDELGDELDEALGEGLDAADESEPIEPEMPDAESAPDKSAGHRGHSGHGGHRGHGYQEVPVED